MQASEQNLNFVYLQKTKILILHLVAIKPFYPATKFRNIMNDYKHGLNIQCSTVADEIKLLCCNGNQIHLVPKMFFLGQKVFVYQI